MAAGTVLSALISLGAGAATSIAAGLPPQGSQTAGPVLIYRSPLRTILMMPPCWPAAESCDRSRGRRRWTVFDVANSSAIQYMPVARCHQAHKYQGIVVQPIFGTTLLGPVKQAIATHVQVADLDQELGPNLSTDRPQVNGLAANVVFVPTEIGQNSGLVVHACAAFNPCQVGYIYDVKAWALDQAIYRGFSSSTAGHINVKIVAEGQSYFTPWNGLTAAQSMLQSDPDLSLIVGSDQGIEGAQKAVANEGKTGKVILVGYGGSAAALAGIRSGAWYGDVAQLPTSEGRLAVEDLIKAIRTGISSGAVDPVAQLPNGGAVTRPTSANSMRSGPVSSY